MRLKFENIELVKGFVPPLALQLLIENAIEGCYKPRAGARTPMQWTGAETAGFSTASKDKLWQPVDADPAKPNVQAAEANPNSLLHATRKLINMRRTEKALQAQAEFEILYVEKNKYPFVFLRRNAGETVIVAFNPSGTDVKIAIPNSLKSKTTLISGSNNILSLDGKNMNLQMKGVTYSVFKLKK